MPVIGSDTAPPFREVLNDENGAPFFDTEQLDERVIEALTFPRRFRSVRAQAQRTILEQYDLTRICLPKMMAFMKKCADQDHKK